MHEARVGELAQSPRGLGRLRVRERGLGHGRRKEAELADNAVHPVVERGSAKAEGAAEEGDELPLDLVEGGVRVELVSAHEASLTRTSAARSQ